MHRRRSLWLVPAAILALTATAVGPAAVAQNEEDNGLPAVVVAGFVPSREADVLLTNIKPLTDYLTEALGHPVWGNVTQDYAGLVIAMETGQAQIGALPPFGMVQAMDRAGVIPILQTERDGQVTYHAQWFTNNPDKYCADDADCSRVHQLGRRDVLAVELQRHQRARDRPGLHLWTQG